MKPFQFLEPRTLEEACSLLSEHKTEAKLLAGGQSLVPILRQRLIAPNYIINIKGLSELDYIKELDNEVRIGAMTTHRTLETSPIISQRVPMLVEMERSVASVQIRNWGTVGGSIAHADPAGDVAPAFIALGARVKTVSTRGERGILLEDFMTGYLETALEVDEILAEIAVPFTAPNSGGTYLKEVIRAGDAGIASVAALVTLDGKQQVKEARLVLGAQGAPPIRAIQAEKAAVGKQAGENIEDVAEAAAEESHPITDILGTEEYKRELVKVLVKRALSSAIVRAQAA